MATDAQDRTIVSDGKPHRPDATAYRPGGTLCNVPARAEMRVPSMLCVGMVHRTVTLPIGRDCASAIVAASSMIAASLIYSPALLNSASSRYSVTLWVVLL